MSGCTSKGAELFGLLAIFGGLTLAGYLAGTHYRQIVAAAKSVAVAWWWLKKALGFGHDA